MHAGVVIPEKGDLKKKCPGESCTTASKPRAFGVGHPKAIFQNERKINVNG